MTLLVTAEGVPVPPSGVTDRLRRLYGEAIVLVWGGPVERCWQVRRRWPQGHRGWARVQAQEIPASAAFDIVGRLPADCAVDEAPAYLERALRMWPEDEVRRMADALRAWNADVAERQVDAAVEAVLSLPDPASAPAKRRRKA